jgi:gamma-glutamyltranspeptidase
MLRSEPLSALVLQTCTRPESAVLTDNIGGGFMLIRAPPIDDGYGYINFREEAPMSAHRDMFVKNPIDAQLGGKAVGVPGELKGFEMAHKIHGKLPWHTLVEPSIKLAMNGWMVDEQLAKRIQSGSQFILNDTALSSVFAPSGKLLVKGDTIYRLTYAKTLQAIADNVSVFYTGWIAKELISTINNRGGNMTFDDFASYKAKAEMPIFGSYKGYTVVSTPPPSSGAVLISALNILENYSEFKDDLLNSHRLVEVFKHAFAQRGFYGDPIDVIIFKLACLQKYIADWPILYSKSRSQ